MRAKVGSRQDGEQERVPQHRPFHRGVLLSLLRVVGKVCVLCPLKGSLAEVISFKRKLKFGNYFKTPRCQILSASLGGAQQPPPLRMGSQMQPDVPDRQSHTVAPG